MRGGARVRYGGALAILDASIHVRGDAGARAVPVVEFFRLPGDRPDLDTTLRHGELITHVELPAKELARTSCYLKVRDRRSYAFALVSVAAGLQIRDGVITDAAIALGGVAAVPWRVPAAEQVLRGQPPSTRAFEAAAGAALADAQPLTHNGFKVDLAMHAVVRALTLAAGSSQGR